MPSPPGTGKRRAVVALAGGGHAHLHTLKNLGRLGEVDPVLISPDRYHYYSGMAGMLSGRYDPREIRFDVQALVESHGGRFIRGEVASVEPGLTALGLAGGETVPFDVVSFNVGSRVPADLIAGAPGEASPVKPVANLIGWKEDLLEGLRRRSMAILVVGAGAAGVELAGNIARLAAQHPGRAEITLAGADASLLPTFPARAAAHARASLEARGIRIRTGCPIVAMGGGVARTAAGPEIPYDAAILATGIRPPPIFRGSGLATAPDGSLLVNPCLQSVSAPHVFGGGDCVTLQGQILDRVGVYAVRAGPVLLHNLSSYLQGQGLMPFRPQGRYLLILNLGDGTGLLVRGRLVIRSPWALRLKDLIDRRFMARYAI